MINLLFTAWLSSTASADTFTTRARSTQIGHQRTPPAPYGVQAAPVSTRDGWRLEVSWMAGSSLTSHYEVWRWRTGTGWQLAGMTRRSDTDFIDRDEAIEVISSENSWPGWEGYTTWLTDQPVYRVRAISRWGNTTSEAAWATNQIPGMRLSYLPVYGSIWNNPYMVAESWEDTPSNLNASAEEVALTGGNVLPHWNGSLTEDIESGKMQKVLPLYEEARSIAAEADVPLRILNVIRNDVYNETGDKPRGFDDSWLQWASRAETCEVLMKMVDDGFTVHFQTGNANNPDFWHRVWGAPFIEEGDQLYLDPETCGPDASDLYGSTAPLFYSFVYTETKTVSIGCVVTDLTNPDFIEWSTDRLAQFFNDIGADLGFLVVKSSWHGWSDEKSPSLLTAEGLTEDESWNCNSWSPSRLDDWEIAPYDRSPLTACSGYGPGEFEAAMRKWVRRFSGKLPGVQFVTNENPAKGDMPGKHSWTNDEPWLDDLILGEVRYLDPCDVYSQCYVPAPAE